MWTLDSSLGLQMTRTARSMKRALDAKLVKHNLTATQYIVLARLWEEDGNSLTDLGERLYLDNPTLTGIVDRMERNELLQRRRDGDDRRVVNVYLTDKGKSLQKEIGHLAEETDAEAWKEFPESERKDLLDRLRHILKIMDGRLD
jgi:DNA-binding MarR family transcriptional regulator